MTHLRVVNQQSGEALAEVYNVTDNEIPKVSTSIRINGESRYVRNIVNSYETAQSFADFGMSSDPLAHDAWLIVEVA